MAYALRQLPTSTMGLWQVLYALIGAAVTIELGFSFTIGRFASYFMGGARAIPRIGLAPPEPAENPVPNYNGILSLVALARHLYRILALATTALAITGWAGWCFWKGHHATPSEWALLLIYAAGTGINMAGMFWTGLLFGMNHVRDHQRVLLYGLIAGYAISVAGLRLGWGLWALVLGQLVLNAVPRWWARSIVVGTLKDTTPDDQDTILPLAFRDLWATTWRSGYVNLGNYLMCHASVLNYSLWTPLERMASYGLTFQAVALMRSLGDSWLLVKLPWIGSTLARGDVGTVRRVFVRRTALAGLTYLAGCTALATLGPLALALAGSQTPLATPGLLALACLLLGLDLIPGAHSALMMSFNQVPHGNWYLLAGIASLVLGSLLGWLLGGAGVLMAPLACGLVWLYWRVPVEAWKYLRHVTPSVA